MSKSCSTVSYRMEQKEVSKPAAKSKAVTAVSPKLSGRARMQQLQAAGHVSSSMMQTKHTPLTPARVSRWLEKVAITGNLTLASITADGWQSSRVYKRAIEASPELKQRYLDALDVYSSTIARILHEEVVEGVKTPIVSAGEILTWVRKRDPKLLAMLARKHDKGLRDVKTQITLEGKVVDSEADPAATILSSDLWQLNAQDSAELLRILKIIMDNRNADLALQPMKMVEGEFTDIEPMEAPEDRAAEIDPWELDEIEEEDES